MRHNAKQLKLVDFEKSVLSSIWDEAQDMMHKGGVTQLHEVDKQFWTSRVFDGKRSYEVEVLLDGRRIKGYTCDCWAEHRTLMCKHVAAGTGALRQYLEQREMERRLKKQESTPISAGDKLNIVTILKRTPPEALADFVQEYASNDKAFATLLKSRFASWLTGETNYYQQIIEGLIPEKHAGALSPTEQRKVQRIVEDLVRQGKSAVAESDMHKAWLIHTGLIQGLPRLVGKMHEMYQEPYHGIFQQAYLSVLRLNADQVSPELWEQRNLFMIALLEHKFLNDSALRMLVKSMETEPFFWQAVEQRWEAAEKPFSIGLLTAYVTSLVRRKMGAGVVDVLRHFVDDRDMAARVIMQLYHLSALQESLDCGVWFSSQPELTLVHKNSIGQIMLSAATKLGNHKMVLELLYDRMVSSNNLDYFAQMRETVGASAWTKHREVIIEKLRTAAEWRLLCAIYMQEKEFEALGTLLRQRADMSLLHLIEKPLIVHTPDLLRETYIHLFSAYLQAHFGNPAADYVRTHLLQLLKSGGSDVGKSVAEALVGLYPERTALLDLLQDLFPKRKIRPFLPR